MHFVNLHCTKLPELDSHFHPCRPTPTHFSSLVSLVVHALSTEDVKLLIFVAVVRLRTAVLLHVRDSLFFLPQQAFQNAYLKTVSGVGL